MFAATVNAVNAQVGLQKIDSLKNALKKELHDTIRIDLMNEIAYEMNRMSDTNSLQWSRKAFKKSNELDYPKGTAMSLYNFAWVYEIRGDYKTTLQYQKMALSLIDSLHYPKEYAKILSDIANSNVFLGNPSEALSDYLAALRLYEKIKDQNGISATYVGLGNSYYYLNDSAQCLSYYRQALEIQLKTGNKRGALSSLANLGIIYSDLGKYDLAIIYHEKSLEIEKEFGQRNGIAQTLNNIGIAYFRKGDANKAIEYYNKAKTIYEETGDKKGMVNTANNMASVFVDKKQYDLALQNYLAIQKLVEELQNKPELRNLYKSMSHIYYLMGDFRNAYLFRVNYDSINSLIFNQEKIAKMDELAVQYETEKKDLEIENSKNESRAKDAEIAEGEEREKRKNQLIWFFAVALVAAVGLTFVIYKGLLRIRKANRIITMQKEEITLQKEIVEEKNREITDSILYAKHLQDAILPPEKELKSVFPDSFLFYKPKDIVAGDFYFLESHNGYQFLAVADCTGHGVPGAMVSVVCSNALSRAVKEFGISDPGKILDKVTRLVTETFGKGENEVMDGMDISLCCFRVSSFAEPRAFSIAGSEGRDVSGLKLNEPEPKTSNLKLKTVYWAGANNALWILRKGEKTIEEIKPDKQPVGSYITHASFTTTGVELKKGDRVFLFSDGFADQMGGEKGKKFKQKNLRELLVSLSDLRINDYSEKLKLALETWKGENEQVDDITILGFEV